MSRTAASAVPTTGEAAAIASPAAVLRPVNVLDLRDTHEIGGPGKTILETFRAVDTTRFRLHLGIFLVRGEATDTPFTRAARACGMPVHFIPGFNQFDPRLITRTAALMKRLDIDIVHGHEVKSDIIALLASRLHRAATVSTLHGWIANGARQRAFIALDRRAMRWFDRVVVVSRRMEQEVLASGVRPERVRLVHNAIVAQNYRRTGARGHLRDLVGRAIDCPVLATVGRLSREKGHADLLDAMAIVVAAGHRVFAVFAGDGPERPGLEQKARALGLDGLVHFAGYVAQPQRILEEADLMVLPSHTEGLPNAALEALAMRVPVLATAVGGTPDVISDGDTGRLVPPHAPEALARGIVEFLADRPAWRRMAERGGRIVERRFDFGARTREMERIYLELAEGRRR